MYTRVEVCGRISWTKENVSTPPVYLARRITKRGVKRTNGDAAFE